MNALVFAGQENVALRLPPGKERPRLKSAPELHSEKSLKTPCTPLLAPCTPLQQRAALGSLKKVKPTPNIRLQKETVDPRCQEQDGEPDIEKMFPYSPDEFERYGLTDGVVYLSRLPLAGSPWLPWHPVIPEVDDITLEACEPLPLLAEERGAELDEFLLTLDELTVELPPPPEDDLDL